MSKSMMVLAAAVAFGSTAATAQAQQEVRFTGSTSGSFVGGSPRVTYTAGSFNDETALGFLGLGAAPGQVGNLGFVTLTNPQTGCTTACTVAGTFNLMINFTAPGGILPGGSMQMFSAALTGAVRDDGDGGIFINFDNSTRNYTFTTPNAGSFTLTVNDLAITNPQPTEGPKSVAVTGVINAAVVPEPSTYALMGAGLAGLVGYARRRRAA